MPVEKKVASEPELERNLNSVLEGRTAGDPDDEDSLWTDLSPQAIAGAVTAMGTSVCPSVVRDWLDDQGLALHKIAKSLEGGQSPDRNTQFLRLAELKADYAETGNPVFSMDSKAREHLGQLYRAGRVYTQRAFKALDHATSILLLCDGGGSNSASHYLFKQDLQEWVNNLGIEIRMAHYPSYCSKYNPIERRFFSQVSRACKGMLFDTLETAVRLMRKTSTTTGLKATVNVIRRIYELKRKVTAGFKSSMELVFDKLLPKWNYVAVPQ